jgi:hypothetical protein
MYQCIVQYRTVPIHTEKRVLYGLLVKQVTIIRFVSIHNAKFGICTVVNQVSQVHILASTKCPTYTYDTVQMPNLTLIETKFITVRGFGVYSMNKT